MQILRGRRPAELGLQFTFTKEVFRIMGWLPIATHEVSDQVVTVRQRVGAGLS
jgi:hypothetical protein